MMSLHVQLDDMIQRVLPVVQSFHAKGLFSPHAAIINNVGELAGHALTTDGSTQMSVSQAIAHFEREFAIKAKCAEIQASGIFYHSPGVSTATNGITLPPADTVEQCRTIVALLEHSSGDSVYLIVPYSGEADAIEYGIGKLIEKPANIFQPQPGPTVRPWWRPW